MSSTNLSSLDRSNTNSFVFLKRMPDLFGDLLQELLSVRLVCTKFERNQFFFVAPGLFCLSP